MATLLDKINRLDKQLEAQEIETEQLKKRQDDLEECIRIGAEQLKRLRELFEQHLNGLTSVTSNE